MLAKTHIYFLNCILIGFSTACTTQEHEAHLRAKIETKENFAQSNLLAQKWYEQVSLTEVEASTPQRLLSSIEKKQNLGLSLDFDPVQLFPFNNYFRNAEQWVSFEQKSDLKTRG